MDIGSLGAQHQDNLDQNYGRVFRNVVRGFSLVLHDPKGSHYKNLEVGKTINVAAGL
jgi:hypothetical protein